MSDVTAILNLSINPLFSLERAVSFSPTTDPLEAAPTVIMLEKAGDIVVVKLKSLIKPALSYLFLTNAISVFKSPVSVVEISLDTYLGQYPYNSKI